ncbi:MAG: ATP-dependent DNA ligase [Bacteroidota bacterium]|nr:ATP-dependent DNA ligase [Bacteroidota bacterium]
MGETLPGNGGLKQFASLVNLLGSSTGTNDKLEALQNYFAEASDADKVWVIALFSGRKPKRTVNSTQLQEWCRELTGYPKWLFEECYHTVGDLAETIALLLPEERTGDADIRRPGAGLSYYLEKLMDIGKEDEPGKKKFVLGCWNLMDREERLVFNKLITGGFRIGVSQKMMVNALAASANLSPSVIAHRISGNWDPSSTSFDALLSEQSVEQDISRPYPFYLAYALESEPSALGGPEQWQAEWKWDGIRGQLVKRAGQLFVWSRGEELMTGKFPEYQELIPLLSDGVVLDGEIIGLQEGAEIKPLPFAALQTRIGRIKVTKKQLTEVPVAFIAYDLLESEGADCREQPLGQRREWLEKIVKEADNPILRLSPLIHFSEWEELRRSRELSRETGSEGIMLKKKNSPYQAGRRRGDWWKWKIDPLVIDAVMIYAQKGHGRRSNLYTDYTFAVRDGDRLVGFTKAYSGLTDKELAEVDAFVKRNAIEKFGPVRTVKPELVFEIAFEGIAASSRHKSGVALRFPRINRWRKDKKINEINTLEDLQRILREAARK